MMDIVMIALAVVSLVSAIGFGGFAWYLLREERRRSAARVAALSAAIDGPAPAASAPRVADLFGSGSATDTGSHLLIKVAAAATMGIVLVAALTVGSRGGDGNAPDESTASRTSAPLELVSMQHSREGDTLTVSGIVRNPHAGAPVSRVTAVVVALNRAGAVIATGRAALDITTIAPGDDSPFVVTVPGVRDVGRYRVSFRTDAGGLRHVDRRADSTQLATAGVR